MQRIALKKTKVRQLLKEGKTFKEIGEELGCTRGTVKNRLEEWNITLPARGKKKSPCKNLPFYQDKDVLEKAYKEIPSTILLGEKYGVSTTTIRQWLKFHGIKITYKRVVSNADYSKPWTNEKKLKRAYAQHGATILARRWGCNRTTIFNWLRRFGIKSRSPTGPGVSYEQSYAPLRKRKPSRRASSQYESRQLKKRVGKCQLCGYQEHVELLDVHHLDRDHFNNKSSNLVVLCVLCHALDTRKVKRIDRICNNWSQAK